MEIILWLGVLFLVIPFIIGLVKGSFETMTISDKEVNPIWAYVVLGIGAVLVFWGFSNLAHLNLKNICLLLIKWIIGFPVLIVGIWKCTLVHIRNNWSKRIQTALDGSLGREIKKYIPNSAKQYWVYEDNITYMNRNNQKYHINFNDFGYENIPAAYANAVCEWLLNNIISKPYEYEMRRIFESNDEYVSGTPDTIKTVKTYDGYESWHESGTESYRTIENTIGYELIHKPLLQTKPTINQNLKKW